MRMNRLPTVLSKASYPTSIIRFPHQTPSILINYSTKSIHTLPLIRPLIRDMDTTPCQLGTTLLGPTRPHSSLVFPIGAGPCCGSKNPSGFYPNTYCLSVTYIHDLSVTTYIPLHTLQLSLSNHYPTLNNTMHRLRGPNHK